MVTPTFYDDSKPLFKVGEKIFVFVKDTKHSRDNLVLFCKITGYYSYGYELVVIHTLYSHNRNHCESFHKGWIEEKPERNQSELLDYIMNYSLKTQHTLLKAYNNQICRIMKAHELRNRNEPESVVFN